MLLARAHRRLWSRRPPPPPPFRDLPPRLEAEVFAFYWLLALAPAWRSTVYTFSDSLYEEVSRAPRAGSLLRIALDVLDREAQESQYRHPEPSRRPPTTVVRGARPSARRCDPCC